MVTRNVSSACLLVFFALATNGQAPPATPAPTAPPTPVARPVPTGPPAETLIAGIPVNYHEDKVGTYTLADPLKLEDGTPVRDAKTWFTLRRPEILKMFETQQYGVMPGRP